MQLELSKKIRKIFTEFRNLNTYTKRVLRIGLQIFLFLFALGTSVIVINSIWYQGDLYIKFVGNLVVKSSFTVLAEITIGSLVLDYVFKK